MKQKKKEDKKNHENNKEKINKLFKETHTMLTNTNFNRFEITIPIFIGKMFFQK